MCFAPQRRALFEHLNFQRWSKNGVFCTFWLGHVLRATPACTFWTSQLPKVVRMWGALSFLTWKNASRHNGVPFFISHPASWLRTRRFSEPTFRPSGATNHWKDAVNRDFLTFSRTCIFLLLTLTLSLLWSSHFLTSPPGLFPPPLFPSVHIVGSLTSKLPLTMEILLKWMIWNLHITAISQSKKPWQSPSAPCCWGGRGSRGSSQDFEPDDEDLPNGHWDLIEGDIWEL